MGIPINSSSSTMLLDSSSTSRSTTSCEATTSSFCASNWRASRRISRKISKQTVFYRLDRTAAFAIRTDFAQDVLQAFARAFARQLNQAQRGDLADRNLRMVTLDTLLERTQHLALMLGLGHVDEVDDDDPPEISEPQMTCDGLRRLEIGLVDGLLEVPVPHEASRVDVDGRHRLGLIEDQVAAGLQLDLPLQRTMNFVLGGVEIEYRPFAGIMLQAGEQLGRELCSKTPGPSGKFFLRIDPDLLGSRQGNVTNGSKHQREIFMNQRRRAARLQTGLDRLPHALEKDHVRFQLIATDALGRGARNESALMLVHPAHFSPGLRSLRARRWSSGRGEDRG